MENNYCNGCPGGDEPGEVTFMGPLGKVKSAYAEIERFKDSTLKKYSLDEHSVEVIESCREMEPLAPLVFLEKELNKEERGNDN